MNDNLLESLLHEGESAALDFKRDQYPFAEEGAYKGELLKDIMAFANAWRRETAYILIGVEDVSGGRSRPVGVTHHLHDHELQQFINSKTQRPISFKYVAYDFRGTQLGILEIPVQPRPFYLVKDYAGLRKNDVYIRRGSSTDIATPDEVAQMGMAAHAEVAAAPTFSFQLLDWDAQRPVGDDVTLKTLVLDPSGLPRPASGAGGLLGQRFTSVLEKSEDRFFDEVTSYVRQVNYFEPVGFWLHNTGAEAGRAVSVSLTVPKAQGLRLTDSLPTTPSRYSLPYVGSLVKQIRQGQDPDPDLRERPGDWKILIPFGLLNPKAEAPSSAPIWLGADSRVSVELRWTVFAENLANPIEGVLRINLVPETREMTEQHIARLMKRR